MRASAVSRCTLFLAQDDEDILQEIEDLEGMSTNLLTIGCSPYDPQPGVLLSSNFQYQTIPACLSFSLAKRYILWYEFVEATPGARLYDLVSQQGVLYHGYPMYRMERGTTYMGLVFQNQGEEILIFMET